MDRLLEIKKLLETKNSPLDANSRLVCQLLCLHDGGAPAQKQDIASSEWDTHRRRFPDWQPVSIQYQKFRRHYLITQEAQNFLFTQP